MRRIVVIGGSGHVGTYLIPFLVEAGFEVTEMSRSAGEPYLPNAAWKQVKRIKLDRVAAEKAGTFGQQIAELEPDVVIDMICFKLDSARHLVESLRGKVEHFLHCGTIWIHGHATIVPTTEDLPREPFGDYGIQKSEIEKYLRREARLNHFPATMIHPGHIVGPGHFPLSPTGNKSLNTFEKLAKGEEVLLPDQGLSTLHHVHAEDVARLFMEAIFNWSQAVGESFHAVSSAALTMRGYAEALATWFGKSANLIYLPWEKWIDHHSEEEVRATWDHMAHSPNASMAKAKRVLGFTPRHSSLDAVKESLVWLIKHNKLSTT